MDTPVAFPDWHGAEIRRFQTAKTAETGFWQFRRYPCGGYLDFCSGWLFSIAKESQFFEGKTSLTFDTLKNVGQIVKGFEVEECPLILWEEAILCGYEVFRQVLKNQGGGGW